MLYNYALFPPQGTPQQIDLIMSRIKSDLNSLVRVKNRMTSDQWVEVNRAILTLIGSMEKSGHNTLGIRAVKEALR